MQNWQKDRNYHKRKNPDGSYTFIITIESTDVEVTEEVYLAYSQADRRERYLEERDAEILLSLDCMECDSVPEHVTGRFTPSTEDIALRKLFTEQVMTVLEALPLDERSLIEALVIDGVTERDYAIKIGLSQKGVNKRRKKILEKIKILVLKT